MPSISTAGLNGGEEETVAVTTRRREFHDGLEFGTPRVRRRRRRRVATCTRNEAESGETRRCRTDGVEHFRANLPWYISPRRTINQLSSRPLSLLRCILAGRTDSEPEACRRRAVLTGVVRLNGPGEARIRERKREREKNKKRRWCGGERETYRTTEVVRWPSSHGARPSFDFSLPYKLVTRYTPSTLRASARFARFRLRPGRRSC